MHWHSSCFGSCSVFQQKSLCYTFFTWLTVDIRVDIKILINPCTLTGGIFSWSFFSSSFCWCSFPYHHPLPLFFFCSPPFSALFPACCTWRKRVSWARSHFPRLLSHQAPNWFGTTHIFMRRRDEKRKRHNAGIAIYSHTHTHLRTCTLGAQLADGNDFFWLHVKHVDKSNPRPQSMPMPIWLTIAFFFFFFGFLVFPAWMTANCWAGVFFLGSAHHFASCNFKPFSKSWPTEQASVSVESQTFVIHVLAVSGIGFAASDNSQKGRLKP